MKTLAAFLLLATMILVLRRRQPEAWGRWSEPDDGWALGV